MSPLGYLPRCHAMRLFFLAPDGHLAVGAAILQLTRRSQGRRSPQKQPTEARLPPVVIAIRWLVRAAMRGLGSSWRRPNQPRPPSSPPAANFSGDTRARGSFPFRGDRYKDQLGSTRNVEKPICGDGKHPPGERKRNCSPRRRVPNRLPIRASPDWTPPTRRRGPARRLDSEVVIAAAGEFRGAKDDLQ